MPAPLDETNSKPPEVIVVTRAVPPASTLSNPKLGVGVTP
jgi:hypothetical protein